MAKNSQSVKKNLSKLTEDLAKLRDGIIEAFSIINDLTEDELAQIGAEIIKAVGLELANGSPVELARASFQAVAARPRGPSKAQLALINSIEKVAVNLIAKIDQHDLKFRPEFNKHRIPLEDLKERAALLKGQLGPAAIFEPPSYATHLYRELDSIYRKFFGEDQEPAYTFDEEHGFPGAFWDFVRAVREATGAEFTEAAITKARQRQWKKWYAKGLVCEETKPSE